MNEYENTNTNLEDPVDDILAPDEEVAEQEGRAPAKPDVLLDWFVDQNEAGAEEDEIVMALHNEHGLGLPAAVSRYRKLRSQAGFTSPRGHKFPEVKQFVVEQLDEGIERKDIVAGMKEKFGYTQNSAQSTYSKVAKDLGLTSGGIGGARVPMPELVAFLRLHDGLNKAELVEKIQEELGYASSTAASFLLYVPMAKEWSRQENAELTEN